MLSKCLERLGVGRELGGELALGFVFAFETGFNLALEKGAPRRHRLGRGAAVFSVFVLFLVVGKMPDFFLSFSR